MDEVSELDQDLLLDVTKTLNECHSSVINIELLQPFRDGVNT